MRGANAKIDSPRAERPVEIDDQLGTREVDVRYGAEEQYHQPDSILSSGHHFEHTLPDVLHIKVEKRRLAADDKHARDAFVLRVARTIGKVGRPRNSGQLGDPGAGSLAEQQD